MFDKESYILISNIEDAEKIAYRIAYGEYLNILFESSYLKDIFFNIINENRPDITIINCNSNFERFEEKLWKSGKIIIFNNINKCTDDRILNIIKTEKGILIC